ncbi:MAG: glycosyltransferase family 4 protein [Cyanobacteria bacterium CRU_2_1]|nr:glycosyltransferase family 4 protein [Cyanobacteria bacterium RU_5_0]NJR59298.1 glycosyltransferase family 4 protein [Cyanobacteria bacterium CRU_2_1]
MVSTAHTQSQPREFASLPGLEHLKVTLVVSDLSKRGAGRWGGAVRPFLLAQALRKLGCQVKLVGFTFGEEATIAPMPDLDVVAIAGNPYPAFLKSVWTLLQHIDGDIIYAYKPKPTSFGVALLQKLRMGHPLILDIDDWELSWHGGDKETYRPTLKQLARDTLKPDGALRNPDHPVYLRWMEALVNRADAVTLHTQFLQNRFGGVYVPNGKDVSLFNPEEYDSPTLKQKYKLSDYRTLMFPGAPRPYKGVEDVLMALEQLNQPDLRLVIVGGSPYDDYDRQLTDRWGNWIIQLPKIPHPQMPEVIAAADVIVVPQRDTPAAQAQFPLKLTDGMAMAKPILATRVGDIPRILGNTGYLVDPDSPTQLATQIEWVFAHLEEAIALGKQARQRCIETCSIDTMAILLSDVISQLNQ